jgi:uncharacterized protein (TIGR03000 family)
MSCRSVRFAGEAVLLVAASLLAAAEVQAQDSRGYHATRYPWYEKGYRGYNEPPHAARPANPAAAPVAPTKYTLIITLLPEPNTDEYANSALMIAHLPTNAQVYFGDHRTTSKGMLRRYVSPPLAPGKTFTYAVRVNWVEGGKKVTQRHEFDVRRGTVHCIYLVEADAPFGAVTKVKENLAKLSAADRRLAEAQKFCAVQEQNLLGSMGKPVKVLIKGQPVFLCCEACTTRAKNNADQTLAKVKKLKVKGSKTLPK